jgi:hypothetical protein
MLFLPNPERDGRRRRGRKRICQRRRRIKMTKRVLRFSLLLFVVLLLLSPALAYAQDEPPDKAGDSEGPSTCQVSPGDDPGPDLFGYVWEEVPFDWVEISGTGTVATTASNCDDCGEAVPLGFPFEFYGQVWTGVTISSNGYLTFQDADWTDYSSDCPIWNANSPNDVIAGFWDDLTTLNDPGTIYYGHWGAAGERMFVVQYDDVRFLGWQDRITFQIILYEGSNHILVQFLDVPDSEFNDGLDATIGIEQVGSVTGLTYGCDVDDLAYPGLAVLFRYDFDLGDLVWYDTNQDGLQDAGEPGVEGIDVDLYYTADCSGQWLVGTTTDANGAYLINQVPPAQDGSYCLEFSNIPAGWNITLQNQGLDDTVDSDADPATGQIRNIIPVYEDAWDLDMGLYEVVIEEEEEFVPEWGSIALLGSGLMGMAGYATLRLRRRR